MNSRVSRPQNRQHAASTSPGPRRQRFRGTVVRIGPDWTSGFTASPSSAASMVTSRNASSPAWTAADTGHHSRSNYDAGAASRPTSRYSERASSAASNVSLKDVVDVFVEDKFVKSYNLQYEPVRIRIGDDDGAGPGNVYRSQPYFGAGNTLNSGSEHYRSASSHADRSSSNASSRSQSNIYSMKSSYRENSKTTSTQQQIGGGGGSGTSIISVGGPADNYHSSATSRTSTYQNNNNNNGRSTNNSRSSNDFTVDNHGSSSRQSRQGNPAYGYPQQSRQGNPAYGYPQQSPRVGQEYSVPIYREAGGASGFHRSGSVTIPVKRESDYYSNNGRQTSAFSPDSGRGSVELPISRLGAPTPLPATPIGQQSTINFNSPEPGYGRSAGTTPYPRRQKSVEFSDSPGGESGRQTVSVHDSGYGSNRYGNYGSTEPVSANFAINGGGGMISVGGPDSRSYQQPKARKSNLSNTRARSESPVDGISLGSARNFTINQGDLGGGGRHATPPPPHNSSSLTYAVDGGGGRPSSRNSDRSWSNSPIPPDYLHRPRSSSPRNRIDLAVNAAPRPSSKVGLPTYDRDYVDRSEDDADLDDLSDEERNERLQQKKLLYPESRNAALVAELKTTTSNISASRRGRKEQEFHSNMEKKSYSGMLDRFTAEQFIPQVPYYDEEGFPIAEYKRIFLAKQAANQARKEFQARIDAGEEIEDVASSPEWKRLFIDHAKEEYDGEPFKVPTALPMGQKDILQINLNKNAGYGSKLQPWQMELKRLERYHDIKAQLSPILSAGPKANRGESH